MRRLLAEERGQASAELMGMMVWLLLVTLIVWQICLAAWTYTQVSNAVRTASRVEGRGGDAKKAARNALAASLRDDITMLRIDGDRAKMTVLMPIVIPGVFSTPNLAAHREAELPS